MKHTTRTMIALALVVMTVVPCSLFAYWQFRSDNDYLAEARRVHQEDVLSMMLAGVQQVVNAGRIAEQQVLEAVVTSNMFSGYMEMTPGERLYVLRQVNATLTAIRHANNAVENIYLIGVENNSFTTNYYCDEALLYRQPYLKEMRKAQLGVKRVLPTRKAEYCYRYKQYISPYVVSFVVHLNQQLKGQAISFSQVDIDFDVIREAMAHMDTDDGSFAYVVDDDGMLIYAPEDRWLGLGSAGVEVGGVPLGEITALARDSGTFVWNQYSVRTARLADATWSIVEVNSNAAQLRQAQRLRRDYLLTMLLLALLSAVFSTVIARGITDPIRRVIRRMETVSAGEFTARAPAVRNQDINRLAETFNRMIEQVVHLMRDNERKERERLTMELSAKQSQINSHFLYNTLNTIKWMALGRGQEDIADVTVALVNLLEYSARDAERFVPVKQELGFVEDYLKIQESRTCCRICLQYEIEPEVCRCVMLKMLLQPAIENAVLHGFNHAREAHVLRIAGRVEGGDLVFTVEDNGSGFIYDGLDKLTGMGLTNVEQRIRLHYGEQYGIKVRSEPGQGTVVMLRFPALGEEEAP